MLKNPYIVVFITASSVEEAEKIAKALLEQRVVACVNIVDGVKSLFWWAGKIDEAKEVLLIIKTRMDMLQKLVEIVRSIHSYEVPEIIALPIVSGYERYLGWIDEVLEKR